MKASTNTESKKARSKAKQEVDKCHEDHKCRITPNSKEHKKCNKNKSNSMPNK